MVNVREIDIAYCAGFFDGEGSLMIRRQIIRGVEQIRVQSSIQQNDPNVLAFFKDVMGHGNITSYTSPRSNRVWKWQAGGRPTVEVAKLLLPYLILKKPEAEIIVRFDSVTNGVGQRATVEQLFMRRTLFKEYNDAVQARRSISYG